MIVHALIGFDMLLIEEFCTVPQDFVLKLI